MYEIDGTLATTAKLMTVVTLPAAFVAVTVWFVAVLMRVGVPVMEPFCVLKERPIGNVPEIDQVG